MDTASPEPLPIPARSKRSKLNNQRNKILTQLNQGKSQREIARSLGVHNSAISRWLDTLDQEKQDLSRFRSSRTDALSQIQSKALTLQAQVLDSLMDGLPPDTTLSQKAGLMQSLNIVIGTSYDKERLETGQSTQNISAVSRMIDSAVSDMYKPLRNKGAVGSAPHEGAIGHIDGEATVSAGEGEAGGPGGTGGN